MKYFNLMFLMIFNLLSFSAWSGDVTGKIEYVQTNVISGQNSNYGVIKLDRISSSRPSCATDTQGRMIFSLDSSGGKALLSIALAAKASNASLFITGTGTCHSGLEMVSFARYL
ncbi:hypothetical protein [Vibrio sp. vnigr-6D03]|uniref:hypothetical protein n=1 Tax=Vibrio sp. vnigr-6D03 TaxID=2058088 RepID=UPI0011AF2E04|nr:hypothetical protein [Vibrio sp. vnigr-6D03]